MNERLIPGSSRILRGRAVGVALTFILAGCAHTPPGPPVPPTTDVAPNNASKGGPIASSCSPPVYPPEALAKRLEGVSTIGFLVGADGKVRGSRLYTSSGHASLDEAVRVAIAKCIFKPPMANGQAVQAWLPVQYTWKVD